MSSLLHSAPPVTEKPRPRYLPRLSADPDTRSVQIGIGATILVHLLLLVLLPDKFDNDLVGTLAPEHRATEAPVFNIEMAPDEFAQPPTAPEKPPMKFVETNPDAPDNVPDNTNNFGAQNQQAAQLTAPKKEGGDRPEMEGRKDIEPTQVVSGSLSNPQPASPPAEPMSPAQLEAAIAQAQAAIAREQVPLPGLEKDLGDQPEAYGTNIAKIAPHPEDVAEWKKGAPDAPQVPTGAIPLPRQSQPRPRPQLTGVTRARPAVFAENTMGTKNIGPMAVDAKWSKYGEYLQKLLEAVQMEFDRITGASRTRPSPNTLVRVKFVLNSEGAIARILSVDGGTAGEQVVGWCTSAISNPSPFGKWTDDMVALLGPEQEMDFGFYFF